MAANSPETVVGGRPNSVSMAPGYGRRIRQARLEVNKSRVELAESVGVHPDTIARYEREVTAPPDETLVAIAIACRVKASWLAYGDDAA